MAIVSGGGAVAGTGGPGYGFAGRLSEEAGLTACDGEKSGGVAWGDGLLLTFPGRLVTGMTVSVAEFLWVSGLVAEFSLVGRPTLHG